MSMRTQAEKRHFDRHSRSNPMTNCTDPLCVRASAGKSCCTSYTPAQGCTYHGTPSEEGCCDAHGEQDCEICKAGGQVGRGEQVIFSPVPPVPTDEPMLEPGGFELLRALDRVVDSSADNRTAVWEGLFAVMRMGHSQDMTQVMSVLKSYQEEAEELRHERNRMRLQVEWLLSQPFMPSPAAIRDALYMDEQEFPRRYPQSRGPA